MIKGNIFDINILLLSQKDIYKLKLNHTNIDFFNYNNSLKRKFDPVFSASNIYLTNKEINAFNITNEFWIVILI